jgi:hypothetical protein
MRITERQRHAPCHGGVGGDGLIAFPIDIVARLADLKDGVEDQLQRTAARADDEVSAESSNVTARVMASKVRPSVSRRFQALFRAM